MLFLTAPTCGVKVQCTSLAGAGLWEGDAWTFLYLRASEASTKEE
jgi:hypothetical protein